MLFRQINCWDSQGSGPPSRPSWRSDMKSDRAWNDNLTTITEHVVLARFARKCVGACFTEFSWRDKNKYRVLSSICLSSFLSGDNKIEWCKVALWVNLNDYGDFLYCFVNGNVFRQVIMQVRLTLNLSHVLNDVQPWKELKEGKILII